MKKIILFLSGICFCALAQAQTLLISDIDDTIKMTHVNSSDKYREGLRTDNPFYLMADLYRMISTKFYYVSNAPESVAGSAHRGLLRNNNFPEGIVLLRDSIFGKADKIPRLRKILTTEKPETVVLVGDDAEADPETYQQIAAEFPAIRFITFIRYNYNPNGKTRIPGQIYFVSPAEVAIHLFLEGMVPKDQVLPLIQSSATDLKLPVWTYCQGHVPSLVIPNEWEDWTVKLLGAIAKRCQ